MAQSDAFLGDDCDKDKSKDVASFEDKSYVDLRRDIGEEIENKLCEKFDKFCRLLLDQQKQIAYLHNSQMHHGNESRQGFNNNFQGQVFNQVSHLHHQQENLPQCDNLQRENFHGNVQRAQGCSSQDNETHTMLKAIMDSLAQSHVTNLETQRQVSEQQRRFVEMQAKIDRMECENSRASSSSKQPMVSSPSRPEGSQKAHCNVIHRSHIDKVLLEENEKFLEDFAKHLASPNGKRISTGECGNDLNVKAIGDAKKEDMSMKGNSLELEEEPSPRVHSPPLPFPPRVYTKKEKYVFSQLKKDLGQIGITLPLNENLAQVPQQWEFINAILANKEKIEEVKRKFEPQSHPPLESKELTKLGDPGKFIIPCSLGNVEFDDALCDSGACVNVISVEMAKRIGITEVKPDFTSITFGDASSKTPVGLVEDFPIVVDGCIVPTDLLVVDMIDSKTQPLILGTPFLNTVGAKIDFVKKTVILENIHNKAFYPIKSPLSKSCGTITRGEPSNMEREPPKVENVAKVGKEIREKPRVEVEKKANPKKKKVDPMKDQRPPNEPKPPSITLKPKMVVNGKLECDVKSSNGVKPFAKASVLLKSPSLLVESGMLSEAMARAFGMKLEDRGPKFPSGFVPCIFT